MRYLFLIYFYFIIIDNYDHLRIKWCSPELQKEWWLIELSTLGNHYLLADLAILDSKCSMASKIFMFFQLAKNYILVIKQLNLGSSDENLGTIVLGRDICRDKMPGPVCFEWNSHHQISFHAWTCCQCWYGEWILHPGI